MGADNLQSFHKWKNHEAILKHYTIYAYPRGEVKQELYDQYPQVRFLHAPLLQISASYIRQKLQNGKTIRYLVPPAVEDYIEQGNLFR